MFDMGIASDLEISRNRLIKIINEYEELPPVEVVNAIERLIDEKIRIALSEDPHDAIDSSYSYNRGRKRK